MRIARGCFTNSDGGPQPNAIASRILCCAPLLFVIKVTRWSLYRCRGGGVRLRVADAAFIDRARMQGIFVEPPGFAHGRLISTLAQHFPVYSSRDSWLRKLQVTVIENVCAFIGFVCANDRLIEDNHLSLGTNFECSLL